MKLTSCKNKTVEEDNLLEEEKVELRKRIAFSKKISIQLAKQAITHCHQIAKESNHYEK